LAEALKEIPPETDVNLLVGYNKADDAGVYKINERQALVQTVDFFPPIVDDPYAFGQVAAANALSDIYAMGGRPLTALNIVAFPALMKPDVFKQVLLGGANKVHEAGAVIVGGHSIKDNELKYGLACTGIIDIDKIISNDRAKPGDKLFLTKPLGTGIISTAVKRNMVPDDEAESLVRQMAQLNKIGAELMVKHQAHAATDITGFGILGHGYEMANASGVSIEISFNKLPLIPNVLKFAEAGALTGGASANKEYLEDKVKITSSISKPQLDLLYDAQTSGGLLIALPESEVASFLADASLANLSAAQIGRVMEKADLPVIVVE
jgi:selenide, water dikinase